MPEGRSHGGFARSILEVGSDADIAKTAARGKRVKFHALS
jgi:hypothetical protein